MTSTLYRKLQHLALKEFSDIVEAARVVMSESGRPKKLRIFLIEGSFLDVWLSSVSGSYSYHWDRREMDGSIYRHDNAPHKRWAGVKTFPKHFHDGSEENVVECNIPNVPDEALRAVLAFCRRELEGMARKG